MPYYADVVHQTTTRVRVKLRDKVRDPAFYERLKESVTGIPGAESVEVNPITGSILFKGRDLNAHHIAAALVEKSSLRFEAAPALHPVQRAVRPFVALSHKLREMTGGEVGLTEAGFLALLTIGVVQVLRGNITAPPWYTAFWYAFGVFSKALVEKYAAEPAPPTEEHPTIDQNAPSQMTFEPEPIQLEAESE